MIEEIIAHLESLGFLFVTENAQESTGELLRFKGENDRGFFLEFQYSTSDSYLMDRAEGSKYWDVIGKVTLKH